MRKVETNNVLSCTAGVDGERGKRGPRIIVTGDIQQTTNKSIRKSIQAGSYGLACEDVLDVANGTRRLDWRARKNSKSLLGLVQRLLNVGDDTSDVR